MALSKASRGVTSGRSGWFLEQLVWLCDHGAKAAIQLLLQDMDTDRVPHAIMRFAAGGHVSAFTKLVGIRPIVPIEPLVKLAGGFNRAHTQAARNAALFPLAFGAGAPGGGSTPACAIQLLLEQHPEYGVIKRDAKHGYGAMRRQLVRDQLIAKGFGDSVLPLFEAKYSEPILLTLRMADGSTRYLAVPDGLCQGDDEAAFYYSIGLYPTVERAARLNLRGMTGSFIDDVFMCGPVEDIGRANEELDAGGKADDIEFPLSKAEGYSPSAQSRARMRELRTPEGPLPVSDDGLDLLSGGTDILGHPVGCDAFVRKTLDIKITKAIRHVEQLRHLNHLQSEALLLRFCANNTITHLAYVNRPELVQPLAIQMDSAVEAEVARFAALQLPPDAAAAARLSQMQGGPGFVATPVPEAFVGCWAAALVRIGLHFPGIAPDIAAWTSDRSTAPTAVSLRLWLTRFRSIVRGDEPGPCPAKTRGFPATLADLAARGWKQLQRHISEAMHEAAAKDLLRQLPPAAQAHLRSSQGAKATAWLSVIPASRELRMLNVQWRLAFRRLLRLPLGLDLGNSSATFCACRPRHPAPLTDYHEEVCSLGGKQTTRHNKCVLVVVRASRAAGAFVEPGEPRGLPGFGQGGGDMLVRAPGGTIGDAITDFTVINEQQPKVCAQAATTAYAAAEDAERRKKAKHSEAARALQLGFWPLAMENGGACGPSLQSYFHGLRRLVEAAGGEGSKGRPMPGSTWANRTFMQYWVQLLSVTFQKETANGLLKLRRRLARHFGDGFAPHGSGQHQAPLVVHRENEGKRGSHFIGATSATPSSPTSPAMHDDARPPLPQEERRRREYNESTGAEVTPHPAPPAFARQPARARPHPPPAPTAHPVTMRTHPPTAPATLPPRPPPRPPPPPPPPPPRPLLTTTTTAITTVASQPPLPPTEDAHVLLPAPIRVPADFASGPVRAPDLAWVAHATADLFARLGPASNAATARAFIRLPDSPSPSREGWHSQGPGEGGDHGQEEWRRARRGIRGRGKGRKNGRGRGQGWGKEPRHMPALSAAPHTPGVAATPRALAGIAEAGPGALPIRPPLDGLRASPGKTPACRLAL